MCLRGLEDRISGVPLWAFLSLGERALPSLDLSSRALLPRPKLAGVLVLRFFIGPHGFPMAA